LKKVEFKIFKLTFGFGFVETKIGVMSRQSLKTSIHKHTAYFSCNFYVENSTEKLKFIQKWLIP